MDITSAIAQLLLQADIADIQDSYGVYRISPLAGAETDIRPYLTYALTATDHYDTYTGSLPWSKAHIQIDCFSDVYADAESILDDVRGALKDIAAITVLAPDGSKDIYIGWSKWREDADASEPPDVGQGHSIIRLQSNYEIMYCQLED